MKVIGFLSFLILMIQMSICSAKISKVVVTGAAGRTGSLVFKRLLDFPAAINPMGLVKGESSQKKLLKIGALSSQVQLGDITDSNDLEPIFKDADAVILCTSAVPKIKILSILKVFVLKLFGKSARPEFTFAEKGDPYYVDWLGAKNTIDAAKQAKVKQFIFISSMGGTQPENFLNTIGRVESIENSGNILLWKRKAEKYLIDSGIPYTIIHPGGLIDKPGNEREIVFGIDDKLLNEKSRTIPRADVAEVAVQSLFVDKSKNRSFDIVSKEPAPGQVTKDWKAFFSQQGNCKY